jgi:hypothetical protein
MSVYELEEGLSRLTGENYFLPVEYKRKLESFKRGDVR